MSCLVSVALVLRQLRVSASAAATSISILKQSWAEPSNWALISVGGCLAARRKGALLIEGKMPVLWDSFSSSLPPIPEQRENQPPFSWEKSAYKEVASRTASLESSDCESLDSSLSSEGDAQEYLDEVSLPDFDLLNDPEDDLLCANLMKLIQLSLNKAKINANRSSRLLMPNQLVTQVGKELLHLAYREPCGLRGALIDLCVEQGKGCHSVGQIAVDPSVVPTFQLTLVLRLDSRLWPKIQGLFSSGSAFSPGFSQSLKLSTGFRVIKKKLYSSEQLLIEEC